MRFTGWAWYSPARIISSSQVAFNGTSLSILREGVVRNGVVCGELSYCLFCPRLEKTLLAADVGEECFLRALNSFHPMSRNCRFRDDALVSETPISHPM